MKKILKSILCVAVIASLSSCDNEQIIYDNATFVQISGSPSISTTENSGETLSVTAILGEPQATDITVNFDVTGDASRYTLTPGPSVTIPAGQTSGSLSFSPIDDDDINGDVDIVFTLSSSNTLPIGIGGEGANAVSKTITIVDDNVPCNDYTFSITTDTYGDETFWEIIDASGNVVESDGDGTAYPNSGIASNTTTDYNFTLSDGCYTLRVYDYWGDNGPTFTLSCGSLTPVDDSDGLAGSATLDINTVPLPGFRGSPSSPYASYVETFDFCVNQ
ncbi:hypothetical protein ACFQ1Q_02445 [Winogradskyella litorisediminis]|uniref:Calx-beta domain-containing protein n=1 Tax=Winogradskyella litorisediminis TaxID=1156618 RepID=A0ABW3N363_9FLAO